MKRKWLLTLVLLPHVLLGNSIAQVFSVNAVGYVNFTLQPGFNLVSNPLIAADNTISSLFENFQGGVPSGLRICKYTGDHFEMCIWEELDEAFIPESVAAEELLPGDGVFVFLPGLADRVLTFVGQVPEGEVCTAIPHGWLIKASVVPQTVSLEQMDFPHSPGDMVFVLNRRTQSYTSYQFDGLDNTWMPASPVIAVGEAFFVYRAGLATSWCRTFFVNNPT
jgi:hypothetical protein